MKRVTYLVQCVVILHNANLDIDNDELDTNQGEVHKDRRLQLLEHLL